MNPTAFPAVALQGAAPIHNKLQSALAASPADGPCAAKAEVTIGPDPHQLIDEVVQYVTRTPLQHFLQSFLCEPEIKAAVSLPVGDATQYRQTGLCRYAIHVLRAAAQTAAYSSEFGGAERDALYVATLIEGSRTYLGFVSEEGSSVEDVMNTLVRDHLRRLDRQDERLAGLVRMCLGAGLPDEVDDFYVPRLRQSVLRALGRIQASGAHQLVALATHRATKQSCVHLPRH